MAKFYIDQHGCAKNQTDGELITGFLISAGFEFTETIENADIILINSCGFIESAKKESINAIYNIKQAFPKAKIVLTGCLAERYAKDLRESMPELDGIFGNGDLSKIAEYLAPLKDSTDSKKKSARLDYETPAQAGICCGERPYIFNFTGSAYVKITEGCSNYCSFCAIPIIRGPARSRPLQSIIKEIKELIKNGVYEINLIGQDLAAYTFGKTAASPSNLKDLLTAISDLKGNFIVRTLYIHPDHFDTDILEVFKNDSRFVPYFDIPFQSGDDEIIHAMNRKGTAKKYIALVKKIKKLLPDAVLRTTFLTGFPGETEQAAENTRIFLQEIKPLWSGCFSFSREEDTPAWSMKNRVPKKLANQRAKELIKLQQELTKAMLEKYVSKELDIIIEEVISGEEDSEGLAIGRAWFEAPEVDGAVVVRFDTDNEKEKQAMQAGNVVKARILAVTGIDLDARFTSLVRQFSKSKIQFLQ